MLPTIDLLREQVERHFSTLALTREKTDFPVFAKEHGLSEEDLSQLQSYLRSRRESYPLRAVDWLLWVIYATEVGYNYTGHEYWQSFEDLTPGWEYHDRDRIKTWFKKFQKAYNGVKPSGPWAEHFTIIAWPITHAILPVYLQMQFAKVLYELRYRLAGISTLDPQTIGRLIAVNAHMPSTRFREFLQQEELIGRIVLALLGEEAFTASQPIFPQTLDRIVADLDRVRTSRRWLKETRRVVSDRFKGIGHGSWPPEDRSPHHPIARPAIDTTQFAIRPKMLLRHTGGGTWAVLLDVPSFRNLSALDGDILSLLKNTRCRLNGGTDNKPRGWLLSGNRKGILQSWPDAAKPLIQLERPHPAIDQLLEAECRLSPGPIWLFRISADGTAQQITGGTVRPGYDYILVKTGDPSRPNEAMTSCTLNCNGAAAFRFTIPIHVSAEWHTWIGDLGLHVARTIRVWPAGLPGRGWDGEGSSEWLTTEAPCFGLSHDHPVDSYAFRLNGGLENLVQTDSTDDPIFVRLPPLPAGVHSLTVKARRNDAIEAVASSPPAEGFAQLTVREPEPWTPGVTSHPGLIVNIDPAEPDLDTFWRNESRLSVFGPENYSTLLTIELEAADGRQILNERVGAPIELPITPEKWRRSFERFLGHRERADRYLEAVRGTLTIDAETLGSQSIVFEHDVKPLRWLTRRARDDILVRLVDDTGQNGTEAKVYRCDLDRPLEMSPLALDKVRAGLTVAPPGSLFYAEHAGHNDTVAVSNVTTEKGLQGLGFSPKVGKLARNTQTLSDALRILSRWQEARLSGFLIKVRHRQVVDGILDALYEAVCGQNWADAETRFRNHPHSSETLEILKSRIDKQPSFAVALIRNWSSVSADPDQRTQWFTEAAARYRVCNDRSLCEFALRLASQPQALSALPLSQLNTFISQILNYPATLRGARLLALLAASDDDVPIPSLPRWQW
ncbi:MAG: hypothetical protein OXF79_10890 [Chloroflexi bacterium]|nr:hypothetical protein [Chloroflexota bacterium]